MSASARRPLDRRRDVEDHQLVDAFGVVALGELGRIAGAAQALEVDAFDDEPSRTSRQAMMRFDSTAVGPSSDSAFLNRAREVLQDSEPGA